MTSYKSLVRYGMARYASYLVPGLLILFFGMLALHSTLMLIKSNKNFDRAFTDYGENVITLQSVFFDFKLSFLDYLEADGRVDASAVISKFAILYDTNQSFLDKEYSDRHNHALSDYYDLLGAIQKKAKVLAPMIVNLRAEDSNDALKNEVASRVDGLYEDIKKLQENSHHALKGILNDSHMEMRETRLYWSVIAIGLCGFVLVLLNADKLRQIRRNHDEKIEYLQLLENRLAALEAAHDGIIIIDESGNLSFINGAMCRMLDILPEHQRDYLSKRWTNLFAEDEAEIIEEDVIPHLEENGYWMGELPLYHDDGSVVYTDFSITKFSGGGMIVTVMDVSEKQKAEFEKRQFEDQFYQAQKMEAVGRLAGGIAHDFNNILAAINGYAEFLIEDLDKNSDQHKFASNIIQAGKQAKNLVDQILAFSRRQDSARAPMNLLTTVNEAVSMLLAGFPKTLELKTDIKVSDAFITANPSQISQVLMNLCVNARDAMESDRGVLTVGVQMYQADRDFVMPEAVKSDFPDGSGVPFLRIDDVAPARTRMIIGHLKEDANYVKLSIEDTGTGMGRVVMEHVFEPFFTTKAVDKGTGLGLATVHGIILSHMGALVIDSTIGVGTRFDLYFPAAQSVAMAADENADAPLGLVAVQSWRILLVEDQKYVRDMMERMMQRQGYDVVTCVDGHEALEIIRGRGDEIDLVVTDQNMPKMTGIEMIEQAHLILPDMPFLLVSGYSEKQMQEIIDKHPAIKGVLRKPVSKGRVIEKITEIMAAQKPSQKQHKRVS